eukprot:scaffold5199_cov199-Alexandrium_tamarense.AAC.13
MSIITIVLCLLALLLVDIEAMHSDSDPPPDSSLETFCRQECYEYFSFSVSFLKKGSTIKTMTKINGHYAPTPPHSRTHNPLPRLGMITERVPRKFITIQSL